MFDFEAARNHALNCGAAKRTFLILKHGVQSVLDSKAAKNSVFDSKAAKKAC